MCSHPFSRSKDLVLTDAHIQPLTRKFTRRHTVGLVVVVLVVLVEEVGLEVMLLVLMSSLPPERHLFEHLQALRQRCTFIDIQTQDITATILPVSESKRGCEQRDGGPV